MKLHPNACLSHKHLFDAWSNKMMYVDFVSNSSAMKWFYPIGKILIGTP